MAWGCLGVFGGLRAWCLGFGVDLVGLGRVEGNQERSVWKEECVRGWVEEKDGG